MNAKCPACSRLSTRALRAGRSEKSELERLMSAERLAELPPDELPRLALCLRPRPDHFAEDVAALAAQVGCSPRALADLVRCATADEHLKS